jgi:hypothetical protein
VKNRVAEIAPAGWGARIRTWEWRNQNPQDIFDMQRLSGLIASVSQAQADFDRKFASVLAPGVPEKRRAFEALAALVDRIINLAGRQRCVIRPQYSPDLNPIEPSFSKVKACLRKAAKRTVNGLCRRIGKIACSFSTQECANLISFDEAEVGDERVDFAWR